MSLLKIWKTNPQELGRKQIHQLVALAGEGSLTDDGEGSRELREFLGQVPTPTLASYVDQCLTSQFDNSGFVLQDLVNELGARLGCEVEPGRYRGKPNVVGSD